MRDRRQHTRFLLEVPAVVRHGDVQSKTQLLDISRAGIAFLCSEPISSGTRFGLTFSPPGWAHDVLVEGTVVHSMLLQRVNKYKIGAVLIDVSQELSEQIIEFLYASSSRQSP